MPDPSLGGVLKLIHILSATFLLANWTFLAYWKAVADRRGDVAFVAHVADRIFRADRAITGPLAAVAFASGYIIIRPLGFFGGRIALNGWAIWGLVLFFVAILVWLFVLRPLEVKLADLADEARDAGTGLTDAYKRASIYWLAGVLLAVAAGVVAAALMVFKPDLWPQVAG